MHLKNLKIVLSNKIVWVAALGYFVDIYDLVLFGVVRIESLQALNVPPEFMMSTGATLLNLQMFGMLVGGFAWGILGDKYGRMKTLFASIFLYSIANILNAFASTLPLYGFCRFVAGVGLAGELGVAVTIVSEILPIKIRGLGSVVIGLAGFLGAMLASTLGGLIPWNYSYFVGGALGLVLLFFRINTMESELFNKTNTNQSRGSLKLLFQSKKRILKYFQCLCVGTPIWFIAGILLYFSPEIGKELGISGTILAGSAIFWGYAGSICGDLINGALTQTLESRKKPITLFLSYFFIMLISYFIFLKNSTPSHLYLFCFLLGIVNGYWTLFVAYTSELFGTNLRATVTTSIPNLVRTMVIPLLFIFEFLKPTLGTVSSVFMIGLTCGGIALFALFNLEETFHKNLDFLEK